METSQSVTVQNFSGRESKTPGSHISPATPRLNPEEKDASFDSDNCNFDEGCMEEQAVATYSQRISLVEPEPI